MRPRESAAAERALLFISDATTAPVDSALAKGAAGSMTSRKASVRDVFRAANESGALPLFSTVGFAYLVLSVNRLCRDMPTSVPVAGRP